MDIDNLNKDIIHKDDLSPFHEGEQELQSRLGIRAKMEGVGKKVIRSYMPDQHREFYAQLPFLIVGSVDDHDRPWASILPGNPGFVRSPTANKLQINASVIKGDPLEDSYHRKNAALGLLGIEPHSRRRNRVNGHINQSASGGIDFEVGQSFGNCPQYIQHRHFEYLRDASERGSCYEKQSFSHLDEQGRAMIESADTFFVASAAKSGSKDSREGVDVSHRGGRPGFIKVQGNSLLIPDFPGNNLFNTLGNFLVNPKAGLLFADFSSGELMMLSGAVEIMWEKNTGIEHFQGAQRAWKFTLESGIRLHDALPFKGSLGEYSVNTLMTGTWQEAASLAEQAQKKDQWSAFVLAKRIAEAEGICSFYFQPRDAAPLLPFKAGQHLLVKVAHPDRGKPLIRAYSVSSAPNTKYLRISVKNEHSDGVSQFLHQRLQVGDSIQLKQPRGGFYIDPAQLRPAVLIGAGVGITPMISMATHIWHESIRMRQQRSVTVIQASKTTQTRAFSCEFKQLEQQSEGKLRYLSYVSQSLAGQKLGVDFDGVGRLTGGIYRQILALDDYDFFLCGPAEFMQSQYDSLLELGVKDDRIFAEAFGPAALKRVPQELPVSGVTVAEAQQSLVKFSQSNIEQMWQKGDQTLLEAAEEQGLTPEFSCRDGSCGACATVLLAGSVSYRKTVTATTSADEVLLCCAVPAAGASEVVLKL